MVSMTRTLRKFKRNAVSNKFEDENDDEDDSNLHWLICTTVAGGKPLK
jgi:hypothetical protein